MSSNTKYKHLFEPIKIGKVELKNRIVKNGTGFFWDNPGTGSHMDDKYIAYFETLAKGGLALITSAVQPLQLPPVGPMPGYSAISDEYIPGWKKWADAIHKYDCLAFHQLFHLGPMTPLFVTAPAGISASSIPKEISPRPGFTVPREATKKEIEDVIELFAKAAERMKKAGLDGTEINGGCNHFINNFLSRAWNKRQDEYGCQTMENRTRVFVNIIKEIKRRNGKDWPIIALFNAEEVDLKDGITVGESKQFARIFEEAGADAIMLRAEYYTWVNNVKRRESLHFPDVYFYPEHDGKLDEYVDGSEFGAGANIPMAAAIKKAVSIPVMLMGKMDWDIGEKAIRKGKLDIISMNRRLIADPELPRKIMENKLEDIRPCASCMTCFDRGEHFQPVACRVNASFGKEKEYEIKPAKKKKRVMIVGAGPAGMEAARVSAMRGHEVLIYDKQSKVGGSLPIAAMIKGFEREEIVGFIQYLKTQIKKFGVKINLCKTVTPELVKKVNPDVLILAAGGKNNAPDIKGINRRNVLTGPKLHGEAKLALKFLNPKFLRTLAGIWLKLPFVGLGKNIIIVGGRLHGCQTAEFLIKQKRSRKITIVDTGTEKEIGEGLLEVFLKPYLLYWLTDHGVQFFSEVKYNEITGKGLTITTKDGVKKTIKANTILTAIPLEPNTEIQNNMKGLAKEVYTIGDAKEPHLIFDAVADGARVGHEI